MRKQLIAPRSRHQCTVGIDWHASRRKQMFVPVGKRWVCDYCQAELNETEIARIQRNWIFNFVRAFFPNTDFRIFAKTVDRVIDNLPVQISWGTHSNNQLWLDATAHTSLARREHLFDRRYDPPQYFQFVDDFMAAVFGRTLLQAYVLATVL